MAAPQLFGLQRRPDPPFRLWRFTTDELASPVGFDVARRFAFERIARISATDRRLP